MAPRSENMTPEARERAVEFAMQHISRRYLPAAIKHELYVSAEWGGYARDTYDRIVNDARAELRKRHEARNGVEMKYDAVDFYESVIRDPLVSIDYKLDAQKQLDKLFALHRSLDAKMEDGQDVSEWLEKEVVRRVAETTARQQNDGP